MTPTSPLAPVTKIMLDQERSMVFDAVTYSAFEDTTGRFFFDVVADLWENLQPREGPDGKMIMPSYTSVLRKVSIKEITALLWASLHTYDAHDKPVWELTLDRVRRLVHQGNLLQILNSVLRGNAANSPTAAEVGELSGPAPKAAGPAVNEPAKPNDGSGGTSSGEPAALEPVLAFRDENPGE